MARWSFVAVEGDCHDQTEGDNQSRVDGFVGDVEHGGWCVHAEAEAGVEHSANIRLVFVPELVGNDAAHELVFVVELARGKGATKYEKDREETRKAVIGAEGVGESGLGVLRFIHKAFSDTIHNVKIEVV